jgi:hypothetical protein
MFAPSTSFAPILDAVRWYPRRCPLVSPTLSAGSILDAVRWYPRRCPLPSWTLSVGLVASPRWQIESCQQYTCAWIAGMLLSAAPPSSVEALTSSVMPVDSSHRVTGRHQRSTRDKSHWPGVQPSHASDRMQVCQLDDMAMSAGKLDDARPKPGYTDDPTQPCQLGTMITLAGKPEDAKPMAP